MNLARRRLLALALLLFASALPARSFAQGIVISEIHYNPLDQADPLGGLDLPGGDYEFIELLNAGASPVDLLGASMTAGISYTFSASRVLQPGERVVLVKNQTRFLERYPAVTNRAPGAFEGSLSNGGETLTLKNGLGDTLFSVEYKDSGAWPRRADGLGSSLVLVNPAGDPSDPANWADSAILHGQPGEESEAAWNELAINEVLAHTDPPQEDAVELKNLTGAAINLHGWYLSDDPLHPMKYRITNVVVQAGSYRVFYEGQFNQNPPADPANTPFAISSFGEHAILTAPYPTTNRLRLVDAVQVPATENGVSFGRHPDGTGGFVMLETPTFGAAGYTTVEEFRLGPGATNSLPRDVGAVVINEIMYHSARAPEDDYEYIELHNHTAQAVELTGWVLRGVGDYTFPTGTVIAAGGYLVVAANPATLAAHYGLNPAGVLGPWTGQLQNSGELLRLQNDNGALVDWVEYNDVEPWPVAADGLGPSLERLHPASRGDTSANWQSSMAPTNWIQATWTQTVSGTSHDLRIWTDYNGLVWLDDASVKRVGSATELVANGDFEAGEAGWSPLGNHERSRTEPGQGRSGSRGYGLAAKFTRIIESGAAWVFQGDASTNHLRSAAIATQSGSNYVVSCWVRRGSVGGTVSVAFAGVTNTVNLGHEGTPGAPNTRSLSSMGIRIKDVTHAAQIVGTNQSQTITANISGLPDTVELRYRSVGVSNYTFTAHDYATVSMADDGVAPDLAAGDGLYTGTIPGIAANRRAVLYHIRARSTALGYEALSPRLDDPSRDWGYWVESAPTQTTVPNWQFFVDGGPVVYSNALYATAVSPDGQVFPHAIVRHRGRIPSSSASAPQTGFALRFPQGRNYDAFFASNQTGINFRHRTEVGDPSQHRRTVNEFLAYHLQERLGLTTPATRHVCIWMDGDPTVTMELESPDSGFLENHGLNPADYISRAGYTGRNTVDGDETLDNYASVNWLLHIATGPEKQGLIHSNLWMEATYFTLAINAFDANGDQHALWNMFQHRRADNGLWSLYAWDTDIAFEGSVTNKSGGTLLELHPYYQTPDHPSMWDGSSVMPITPALFHPESGPDALYTTPYRHRQQMNLWRLTQTLFTTNALYPILDQMQASVQPAFAQLGQSPTAFTTQVARVKAFIADRRAWLYAANWSDKDASIWNAGRSYTPSAVVLNEIMADAAQGGDYLELYNPTDETIDLSWWKLEAGANSYRIPHGTLLAPTSHLVIAEAHLRLTNGFVELADPGEMVQRNTALPLWDHSISFLSASEHRTRVVEIPQLAVPQSGATLRLWDWQSNLVSQVSYLASQGGWPSTAGASLERVPGADPTLAASWRRSFIIGTPGSLNTAADDVDGDGLPDHWEQAIVDHFAGVGSIYDVDPAGDEDGDGTGNALEYLWGMDPTQPDADLARVHIERQGGAIRVSYPTRDASANPYIGQRLYTLERSSALDANDWNVVSNHLDRVGDGQWQSHTNAAPGSAEHFRILLRTTPVR